MLRNVKIGTRLGAAVALGLGTTVVIAALGYSGVARVSNMTASMLSHEAKLASVSASARADVQAMRRFEKELAVHVGNADQEAEDLARWNDQRYRLNERLGTLERDTESAEDREARAEHARGSRLAYETGFYRVVGLVRQRSLKTTPDVSKEMASYKDAVERLEASAADLAAANFKRMGDREEVLAAQKAVDRPSDGGRDARDDRARDGLLRPADARRDRRRSGRPCASRRRSRAATSPCRCRPPERDELGQLLSAMGRMAARLRGVVGEVRSGADALARTSGQVVTVVGQVSSASSQVSASAQTLSQGTSEQAASVEETTSSLEQMSASITQNAENSRQMEQMALQGARDGDESAPLRGRHRRRDALDRREDLDRRGDRVPDEPARLERGDRGGARGRARPGLRGRRGRGAQARRAQPGGGQGDRRPRRVVGQGGRALAASCSRELVPVDPQDLGARPGGGGGLARAVLGRGADQPGARRTWTRSRSATPRRPRSCPRRRRRWRARPTRCARRRRPSCGRPRRSIASWPSSGRTPRRPRRPRPRRRPSDERPRPARARRAAGRVDASAPPASRRGRTRLPRRGRTRPRAARPSASSGGSEKRRRSHDADAAPPPRRPTGRST